MDAKQELATIRLYDQSDRFARDLFYYRIYSGRNLCVREFITKHHPDLVLNVVDASCLERNLFLTTQLIDMNIRVVMALNMFDELTNEGSHRLWLFGTTTGYPDCADDSFKRDRNRSRVG